MLICRKFNFLVLCFCFLYSLSCQGFSFPLNSDQRGCFNQISDVFIDESLKIWFADQVGNVIQVYDYKDKTWKIIGKEGRGNKEFYYPSSVFFQEDTLIVADYRNNRVQCINEKEVNLFQSFNNEALDNPLKIWRNEHRETFVLIPYMPGVISYSSKNKEQLVLSRKDKLGFPVSLSGFQNWISVCDQSGKTLIIKNILNNEIENLQFSMPPYDAEFVSSEEILVSFGETLILFDIPQKKILWKKNVHEIFPGLDFVTGFSIKKTDTEWMICAISQKENKADLVFIEISTGKTQQLIGEISRSRANICEPFAVSSDLNRKIYVCDSGNNRIKVYSSRMQLLDVWENFNYPQGIACDEDKVWVSDTRNHRILMLDDAGEILREIKGDEFGGFCAPRNLVVHPSKPELLICDSGNDRIVIINRETGILVRCIGSGGSQPGFFAAMSDILVMKTGDYLVVDYDNHRLQLFDNNWTFKRVIGKYGKEAGEFSCPNSVCQGKNGSVFVTDEYNSRIQIFNEELVYQSSLEGFFTPMAVRSYGKNGLLVADSSYGNVWYLSSLNDLKIINQEVKYININDSNN